MAQRISRAKQTIKQTGSRLQPAGRGGANRAAARRAARAVPGLQRGLYRHRRGRADRARVVAGGDPAHPLAAPAAAGGQRGGRPAGADAADRRAAARPYAAGRVAGAAGRAGPAPKWDQEQIAEGTALISAALPRGEAGPYQLQAAIAAVHDEAATMADTDWPQILSLYDLLERLAPNPFTTLNRAVAAGMVHGPEAGLQVLAELAADKRMARHHRLLAARAHLRELAGERDGGRRGLPGGGPPRDQPARTPLPGCPGRAAAGCPAGRITRRPPRGAISGPGHESAGSFGRRSSRTLSPTLIVPPDRMSTRRPPRWMRSLMMPGRVSFCR